MYLRLSSFASQILSIFIECSFELFAMLILYHIDLIANTFYKMLIMTYNSPVYEFNAIASALTASKSR